MLEYRRHLPHFQRDDAHIFLTWRLWSSLPKSKTRIAYRTPGYAFAAADRALHASASGPFWLGNPEIADLVMATLAAGDTERHFYELSAWVIMPNHVHLLLLPRAPLPRITRWLKGSTAHAANRVLGRTGELFWQDESYDHWVRSEAQFIRIVNYIEGNPVAAGLAARPHDWRYSSAFGQAKPPVPPKPATLPL